MSVPEIYDIMSQCNVVTSQCNSVTTKSELKDSMSKIMSLWLTRFSASQKKWTLMGVNFNLNIIPRDSAAYTLQIISDRFFYQIIWSDFALIKPLIGSHLKQTNCYYCHKMQILVVPRDTIHKSKIWPKREICSWECSLRQTYFIKWGFLYELEWSWVYLTFIKVQFTAQLFSLPTHLLQEGD